MTGVGGKVFSAEEIFGKEAWVWAVSAGWGRFGIGDGRRWMGSGFGRKP